MAQIIKLRRSSLAGQKPSNSNLQLGELAINTTDGKIYFSKSGSNPSIEEIITTNTFNTGSVNLLGDINIIGNEIITGSLIISGSYPPSSQSSSVEILGNVSTDGFLQLKPITSNLNTNITGAYLYVSSSTNDIYFTQVQGDFTNTTRLRWLEGNLYTGLLNGGVISATSGTTTFNISAGSGVIVNLHSSLTDNPTPTIKYVNWSTKNNIPVTNILNNIQSYIAIDENGDVIQQITPYVASQFNDYITLGTVIHQNLTTINSTITYPNVAYGYKQRTYDFIKAFGPLKLSGLEITPNSSLELHISSGTAWADGRNFQVDPNNPSYITDTGTTVSKIYRYYQVSGSTFVQDTNNGIGYTTIDPTNYNVNGTLTPVPGTGSNKKWTLQRVYWYPNSATKGIVVYYGNAYYSSSSDAAANLPYETFNETENTKQNAVYLGAIALRNDADFTNLSTFTVLPGGVFRNTGGSGGGSGISTVRFVDLSDVDILNPNHGDLVTYNSGTTKWEHTKTLNGDFTINGSLSLSGGTSSQYLMANGTTSTISPIIASSGTTNYITKWISGTTLGDSLLYDNGVGVGIGTTTLTGYSLRVAKNITGALTSLGIYQNGTVQSDVTTLVYGIRNDLNTQATGFTLSSYQHFTASQGTIGAGSAVGTQYGFIVTSSLTGATNNYAFYGNIPSSANNVWNLYMIGSANNYMAGSLGIGSTSLSNINLRVSKNISGSTSSYAVYIDSQIQSDVTTSATYVRTNVTTQATTFTLTSINHYGAYQGSFNSGTTVTSQYGYYADYTLSGATNNYGFYGNIASGTNRWNIYMAGTANNYMAGSLGIGSTSLTGYGLRVSKTITGASTSIGIYQNGIVQSDVTATGYGVRNDINTQATTFTLTTYHHFSANQISALGAGSVITSQIGFYSGPLSGGTNNYGFYGNLSSASNVWNLYMGGTALNYFNGGLLIGTTTDSGYKLDVTGSARVTGTIYADNVGGNIRLKYDGTLNGDGFVGVSNSTGNIYLSNYSATRGLIIATNGNIYNIGTGSFGIGTTSLTGYNFRLSNNIGGATTSYGLTSEGNVTSGVTTASAFLSSLGSLTGSTVTTLRHYGTGQGTFVGTVTNQYGFFAHSSLIDATNNYGFYGDIASGTNRWNLYMQGTANNYLAGSLGIGTSSLTNYNLRIAKNITGASTSTGLSQEGVVQSDVTVQGYGIINYLHTAASVFTLSQYYYFTAGQGTIGAGSSVTAQYGFTVASSLTGATNNYAFISNIASGTNNWNLYMNGTAKNYLAGTLLIGNTTDNGTDKVQISGSIIATTIKLSGGTSSQYLMADGTTSTISPIIASSGTTNYITKWISGTTLGNSIIYDDGTYIGLGTTSPTYALHMVKTTPYFISIERTGVGNHQIGVSPQIENSVSDMLFDAGQASSGYLFRSRDSSNSIVTSLSISRNGNIGIGGVTLNGYNLRVTKNITGGTSAFGISQEGIIQSDVTASGQGYYNTLSTAAATFTLANYYHFSANQGTLGAASVVTNQYGYFVYSTLTGATNNYAFYSNIASANNVWNLYMNGTANNYMAGSLGIGNTTLVGYVLRLTKNITGAVNSYGINIDGSIQSDVTTDARIFQSIPSIVSGATLPNLYHFISNNGTYNGTVTSQYGFYTSSALTGATNNYGFYGNIPSGTGRWNLYMIGTASNYFAGSLAIGVTSSLTGYTLRLTKTLTGIATTYGLSQEGVVQSDVTNAIGFYNASTTVASSFTLTNYYQYFAVQSTIGSGSTITNQFGYYVHANMIGATNNYGYYGNIASGSNMWNIYMNGTADNYMAGSLGIGSTTVTGYNLRVAKNITGASSSYGITSEGIIQSDVTANAFLIRTLATTVASAFTLTDLRHYYASQGTLGAGSTVTNQYGYYAESTIVGATNNYGFYGNIASGTNRWNIYMNGTANNYMAGSLGIGSTSLTAYSLRVGKIITDAVTAYGISSDGQIQSDVTTTAYYYRSLANAQATTFSLSNIMHYHAGQTAFSSGTTVTAQYGFITDPSMSGATNNYSYYGQLTNATGRWNIYMVGNADNYMAGALGVGSTTLTGYSLRVSKTITGAASSIGIQQSGQVQSDVTTGYGFRNELNTSATAAIISYYHYFAKEQTITSGTTLTTQYGFYVDSTFVTATNNYGYYGNIASTTNSWNLYMNGTANNYIAGALGIGNTTLTGYSLRISKNITGAVISYGISSDGQIQTDVTSQARMFQSLPTQIVGSTLTGLYHYIAVQSTISGTITNQYGFFVDSSLVGAGSNYGFYGDIPSGTGRWNLYMGNTASNYMAGSLGIGSTSLTGYTVRISKNITGAVISYGILQEGSVLTDVTTQAFGVYNAINTQASAFTLSQYFHYTATQQTIGAGSTVNSQYGYYASNTLSGATSNYGFRGSVVSSSTNWNLYMDGTANNYLNGSLFIGTTTDSGYKLDVTGTGRITSNFIISGNLGVGTTSPAGNAEIIGNLIVRDVKTANTNAITRFYGGAYSSNVATILIASSTSANNLVVIGGGTSLGEAATIIDFNTTTTVGSLGVGTTKVRIDGNGNMGIGSTSITNTSLRISKNIDGSTSSYGIYQDGPIQSGVTATAIYYRTNVATQATTFTLSTLVHFGAYQGTLGAGSTVTNQYGFIVDSSMVGATNNYAYYSSLASGTNRWNLYLTGTASNYIAGSVGIGSTSLTAYSLRIGKNITGAVTSYGLTQEGVVLSDVTTQVYGFLNYSTTTAAAFTLSQYFHYTAAQLTIGAGSAITSQYGFTVASSLSGATNNYGFVSNLVAATNTWNLYIGGTANNYIAGTLGIGSTSLSGYTLRVAKNITGSVNSIGISQEGIVQSDVTTSFNSFGSVLYTQASAFTLASYNHFVASQGTIGSTSAVTTQVGFHATSTLTGATFNYGFYSNIPTTTNSWNLYMAGTANNYMAGSLVIGSTTVTGYNLRVAKNITGASSSYAYSQEGVVQSDVTYTAGYWNVAQTQATVFTLGTYQHFGAYQNPLGAGSVITSQIGFNVTNSLTGATNNYGFYGNLSSASNVWNIYMAGTAKNYINGTLLIGTTTDNTIDKLQVNGSTKFFGSITLPYVAKTAAYTGTTSDYVIDCTTGTFTITLPTAVGITGRVYIVKNTGTGTITLGTTSSQTIDGSTTKSLTQYVVYTVMSNGANWIII
jgi:uncharacterized protein YbaP (TraB family)